MPLNLIRSPDRITVSASMTMGLPVSLIGPVAQLTSRTQRKLIVARIMVLWRICRGKFVPDHPIPFRFIFYMLECLCKLFKQVRWKVFVINLNKFIDGDIAFEIVLLDHLTECFCTQYCGRSCVFTVGETICRARELPAITRSGSCISQATRHGATRRVGRRHYGRPTT